MPSRDYQSEDVDSIFRAWETHTSTLYLAATGLGKTFVMSQVAKRVSPGKVMFLCHRSELIFQARAAFMRAGIECEIEKAELSAHVGLFRGSQVVLATVQTLATKSAGATRLGKFKPMDFSVLLYDECHHAVSRVNKEIIEYFTRNNPRIKVLGVTASADRLDNLAMGQVFQSVASVRDVSFGIENGWLVPVFPLSLRVSEMDFSHIHTTAGDLNQAELAAVMEAEKPIYGIAQGTLESAFHLEANILHGVPVSDWGKFLLDEQTPPRSCLCFTVSVKQAEMLADVFNRVVPNIANWVCGKTPQVERDVINSKFRAGELPILVNCSTHTEGFDAPRAEVVVPKPTKSRALMIQMVGRVFRPAEVAGKSIADQFESAPERKLAISRSRKPRCIVLDFHGVCGKHKLITPFDILGGNKSPEVIAKAIEQCREKGRPVDMTEEMVAAEKAITKKIEEAKQKEASRRARLVGRSRFSVSNPDMFDPNGAGVVRMQDRRNTKVVSPGMATILRKIGVDPYSIPYHEALAKVKEQFGRWARAKQFKKRK